MNAVRITVLALILGLVGLPLRAEGPKEGPRVNKLLTMYQLFYLPFPLEFRAGRSIDTILPYVVDNRGEASRFLEAHELVSLDAEWNKIRTTWKTKSLLDFQYVPVGKSLRVTQRLVSHHLPVTRSAVDTLPIAERMAITESLKGKSPAVIASFYQLRFLKSLLEPSDEGKFNFFVISPSWCESSKEYRVLLETYFKKFANPELTLHSIIVEDPKQEIFDARLMKELFPHPKRYTHETTPRFLAVQTINGQPRVWEEGEALKELYERFYAVHRGFLSNEVKSIKGLSKDRSLDPVLSSAAK